MILLYNNTKASTEHINTTPQSSSKLLANKSNIIKTPY